MDKRQNITAGMSHISKSVCKALQEILNSQVLTQGYREQRMS